MLSYVWNANAHPLWPTCFFERFLFANKVNNVWIHKFDWLYITALVELPNISCKNLGRILQDNVGNSKDILLFCKKMSGMYGKRQG